MNQLTAAILCALPLLAAACGTGGEHSVRANSAQEAPEPGTAVVLGTCLDGETGEPLAGVEVVGPGGVTARSDAMGRFVLADLPEGATGKVSARTADGRSATNPLQRLKNARLEVVLYLR